MTTYIEQNTIQVFVMTIYQFPKFNLDTCVAITTWHQHIKVLEQQSHNEDLRQVYFNDLLQNLVSFCQQGHQLIVGDISNANLEVLTTLFSSYITIMCLVNAYTQLN